MNLFVRFTGCNLKCDIQPGELSPGGFACDTEFASGRIMTIEDIAKYCAELAPSCMNIILTGGEPTLQVDPDLVTGLTLKGYYLAIETNGTRPVPAGISWVTVSPKVAEHCIKQLVASEVKYVRAHGQGIPKTMVRADHYLISPAFDGGDMDRRNMDWCIKLCKENPEWRLSIQQHKIWKVR